MSSKFRNTIPSERFPAEEGRYILYFNHVCPWSHRAVIVRALKGLEQIVRLVEVDARDPNHGWYFSGRRGPDKDPVYGVKWLKQLYLKVDPLYSGRITIPILWDRQQGRCRWVCRVRYADCGQIPSLATKVLISPAFYAMLSTTSYLWCSVKYIKGQQR
jgi:hypothetical protein